MGSDVSLDTPDNYLVEVIFEMTRSPKLLDQIVASRSDDSTLDPGWWVGKWTYIFPTYVGSNFHQSPTGSNKVACDSNASNQSVYAMQSRFRVGADLSSWVEFVPGSAVNAGSSSTTEGISAGQI